jgi:phytoene synthase
MASSDLPADTRSPDEIARRSGSSFLVSFGVLDTERRRGLTAIYAFCRVVDDVADGDAPLAARQQELDRWEAELERAAHGEARTPVGQEIHRAVRRFGVDLRHLRAVLAGVRQDLDDTVLVTTADLEAYCFKVASSVGLACLPVFGAHGERAERYALHLGQALQHTNILRDLRSDALDGRCYVPAELLDELGVERAWLRGDGPAEVYAPGGAMAGLTGVFAARAMAHFDRAEACLDGELRALLQAPEVMGAVYRDLLKRLERLGGEVCRQARRVRVPRWRKLLLAFAVRRRARARS